MADLLTVNTDPNTETLGASLTSDEKESLEIGEQIVNEQQELLAGKYKNAEELEKAYKELEGKLGEPNKEPEAEPEAKSEDVTEETPTDSTFLNSLWEEAQSGKSISDTNFEKLQSMSQNDLAQEYLAYRADQEKQEQPQLSDEDVTVLKDIAGGEKGYEAMIKWASENVPEKEAEIFDKVMDKGDPLACFFAVQALNYRYNDAMGVDGVMLTGKAAKSEGPGYRSQAELIEAMSDPRYDKDPAYRQDVIAKLEKSKDLQF